MKAKVLREGSQAPPPEASVTARKKRKLVLLTEQLRSRKGWTGRPVRIDVIAVDFVEGGAPVVRHFENAVTGR